MGKSKIEWTDRTWNPVRGCSLVSKGCENCYAMHQAHRFGGELQPFEGLTKMTNSGVKWTGKVRLVPEVLATPLHWRKPSKVFVNSMSDLFHEDVPFEFIDQVFAVMASAPQHTFQILTKRPERMLEWFEWKDDHWVNYLMRGDDRIRYYSYHNFGKQIEYNDWKWPLQNVWIGLSVEDQQSADSRLPYLMKVPAVVRFISAEPLLGSLTLQGETFDKTYNWLSKIDWLIVGGESGHRARPMHPDWVRSIRDQCAEHKVPFFFNQWGNFYHHVLPFRSHQHWVNKARTWLQGWNRDKDICLDAAGKHCKRGKDFQEAEYPVYPMVYAPKSKNGNHLDGKVYQEFPEVKVIQES